jgi:hypothetical protein
MSLYIHSFILYLVSELAFSLQPLKCGIHLNHFHKFVLSLQQYMRVSTVMVIQTILAR